MVEPSGDHAGESSMIRSGFGGIGPDGSPEHPIMQAVKASTVANDPIRIAKVMDPRRRRVVIESRLDTNQITVLGLLGLTLPE